MISKNLNNGILPNRDESLGNLQMRIISWTQVVPSYWGTKGVAAALLLKLVIPVPPPRPPTTFLSNQNSLGGFLFIYFFQQTASSRHGGGRSLFGKMKRASWDPVPAVFLLSEQLQAITVVEEEWLLGAQLVTMLLAVGLGCS